MTGTSPAVAASGAVAAAPSAATASPPAASATTPAVPAQAVEPAWRRFAAAAPPADGRPRIVIVIDGLGVDRTQTERAIALPAPLELSFIAYADNLPSETAAARQAGHELLVHVPMAAVSRAGVPGGGALPQEEVLRRLRWDLDRFSDYVGIYDHWDSGFAGDAAAMATVAAELKARGLLLLDSRDASRSLALGTARQLGVPAMARDLLLDGTAAGGSVAARLKTLEATARRNGFAIGVARDDAATLAALADWLPSVKKKGFDLAPLSAVIAAPPPPPVASGAKP